MDKQELMARRLAGQHLTVPGEKLQVCRDLNGLQAQFLSNARHALRIRCAVPLDTESWGDGLVKSWTIRGTMHIFDPADFALFLYRGRDHFLRPADGFGDDPYASAARKSCFAPYILDLIESGVGEREALKEACFHRGMTETEAKSFFDPWGGLLRALAERGDICYRVREQKTFQRCPSFEPMDRTQAMTTLLFRYFTHYGPATLRDAAYWLGKPQSLIRSFLPQLPLHSFSLEGRTFYWIETPDLPDFPGLPDCLFLAGFDPLMLGYRKEDSPFLPPEVLPDIFTRAGIVMPALLLRGRVAGKWKQTHRTLTVTLFHPLSAAERGAVSRAAEALWPQLKHLNFVIKD